MQVLPIIEELKLRKSRFTEKLYRQSLIFDARNSLFAPVSDAIQARENMMMLSRPAHCYL